MSMTLAEFLARPETEPPLEYIEGAVVEKPPLRGHALWLRADLATLLYGWARASRQGAVASGVRCTLGERSYVLDIAYFSPARLVAGQPQGAPDLAIEICPEDVDPAWVEAKLLHCVAHGVRLAWLIDPLDTTVTVYRPGCAPVRQGRGDRLEADDILPGFYLYVDDLFAVLEEDRPR
jgi:Uma2 family endonuclease